ADSGPAAPTARQNGAARSCEKDSRSRSARGKSLDLGHFPNYSARSNSASVPHRAARRRRRRRRSDAGGWSAGEARKLPRQASLLSAEALSGLAPDEARQQ